VNWGRTSGILLHITSLPGPHGIGELGPEAFRFADWLAEARQHVWQVLPLGPVGYGESPYQLFSAFAGNPLMVSIDLLLARGWLSEADIGKLPRFAKDRVEFERVVPWKTRLLRRAFEAFRNDGAATDRKQFEAFRQENCSWLEGYARFMALKEAHGYAAWTKWDPNVAPAPEDIEYHEFLQFEFFRQWDALKKYCADRGIRIMGDLPIYVAHDSADVWVHRDLFRFDAVSGVPPDYFSATGQLWGNPLYQWDRMAANGYRWWIDRMRAVYLAVSLPPAFRYPAEGNRNDVGARAAQTVLERVIMPTCAERGIAFAMMIGSRPRVNPGLREAGDMEGRSDVGSVVNLCLAFPQNKFLVTMLSRGDQHELVVAARKFAT